MSSQPRSWRPILEGAAADKALAAARDIAAAVTEHYATETPSARPTPSLSSGHAGVSLMYAYLDQHVPDAGYHEAALASFESALEGVEHVVHDPSLFSGFTGIAWTAAHLEHTVWQTHELDDLQPLDEALHQLLSDDPWSGVYDLISGLVGIGVYALERPDSDIMRAVAVRVLDHLESCAQVAHEVGSSVGLTWHTPPHHLPEHQRVNAPNGYYNLGLAHGVPGVIAVLAQMCLAAPAAKADAEPAAKLAAKPDHHARAKTLLRHACDWLVANELPPPHESAMRTWLAPGSQSPESRAAWCYGDPGAVIALMQGAVALGDHDLLRHVTELGGRAAERPMARCGVRDTGICHGSAGLGHIYNRLYQATGAPVFADAARRWLTQALDERRPGQGLAGYLSLETSLEALRAGASTLEWMASPGLLTGAAGIALVFLAAVSTTEPAWDRHLLCAVPPGGAAGPSSG